MKNKGPVYDLDDGDFIMTSGDIGYDWDGNVMMRIGDNFTMDMETGDLHFVSGWEKEEE